MDANQHPLRIADDVLVWPIRERGEWIYRIEIPKLHRFFRVGYREYVLMSLLDGRNTLAEACGRATKSLGMDAPTSSETEAIAKWLLKNKIAIFDGDAQPARRHENSGHGSASAWHAQLNPFWIKLPLPKSERIVNWIARRLQFLFATPAIIAAAGLIVVALATALFQRHELTRDAGGIFDRSHWVYFLVIWVVLKIVHELGHAIACRRMGGDVHEAGIVLVLFTPLAFVDVTSSWRMSSRWSRILVAAAGMGVEMGVAAIAMLIYATSNDQETRFLCHGVIMMAGVSTVLFNANVLMRFDGYFILSDLAQIPNLASESSSELRRIVKRWVADEETSTAQFVGWRRGFLIAYGLAAAFWRVMVCGLLAITASVLFAARASCSRRSASRFGSSFRHDSYSDTPKNFGDKIRPACSARAWWVVWSC